MDAPIRVFVVDDTPHLRSLVRTIVQGTDGFEFAGDASDGWEAVERIPSARPDVVLMDVEMPGLDGLGATRIIAERLPDVKIVAWTNHEEPAVITEMIAAGAVGYLLKGISPRDFLESLDWASRGQSVLSRDLTSTVLLELGRLYRAAEERAQQLHDSYLATVAALATALETKDDQTGDHARRVKDYATIITREFEPSLLETESLKFGFLLHDIGKIGIPESILLKPGPLDEAEWTVMRSHPAMGAKILEHASFLQPDGIQVVQYHHERWDGQGYPYGLAGEDIPIGARLFALADTLDAMTSDRPYRKALPLERAFDEIRRCAGSQFDPDVVRAMRLCLDELAIRHAASIADERVDLHAFELPPTAQGF